MVPQEYSVTLVDPDGLEHRALLATLVSVAILDLLVRLVQMEMLAVREHKVHVDPSGSQGNKVKWLSCKIVKALFSIFTVDVISFFSTFFVFICSWISSVRCYYENCLQGKYWCCSYSSVDILFFLNCWWDQKALGCAKDFGFCNHGKYAATLALRAAGGTESLMLFVFVYWPFTLLDGQFCGTVLPS